MLEIKKDEFVVMNTRYTKATEWSQRKVFAILPNGQFLVKSNYDDSYCHMDYAEYIV